jgi:DNA topoisomerase-1
VARLRRVDCSGPGISRRRRGKGFEYLDENGEGNVAEHAVARIRELAIPPAWEDVWICLDPMGHIQATGIDAAGRKQYRYHDRWRERRDREKFDSMLEFARALPPLRARVEHDLDLEDMPRERALACAVRLLERGFFRIGSEGYVEENDTYGIATIRKRHVTIRDAQVVFDYKAKGGQRRIQAVDDGAVLASVEVLKRRRGGGEELLAYKRGRRWVDVKSEDINDYVRAATGGDFSAKDFRTWSATVLAAVALAVSGPAARPSKTARKSAERRVVTEVAALLGNTPAVARASYIDPRVFDRFEGGLTIGGVLPELLDTDGGWPVLQGPVEEAVLDLIEREDSDAIERVA